MKKALFLGLMMLAGSQIGTAQAQDPVQECSAAALVGQSRAMQDRVEAYVNESPAGQEQAFQQLQQLMSNAGVEETLSEHSAELQQIEPGSDSDHQPSQALCDDMYATYARVNDEMDNLE